MKRSFVLAIIISMFLSIGQSFAAPLTGTGSVGDPYLIQSLADFDEYRSNSVYRAAGKTTQLMADLDLTGSSYVGSVITSTLYGTFDGNNKTISNITISAGASSSASFISTMNGVVKNLSLTQIDFTGSNTAGICVSLWNIASVENCYVEGTLAAGGTAEVLPVPIKERSPIALLIAGLQAVLIRGGLAASNEGGTIENSHSSGTVLASGIGYYGGLVGYNYNNGMIRKCYSDAFMQDAQVNSYHCVLVGRQTGIVRDCFWNKDISPGLDGYKPSNSDTVATGLTAVEMQEPLHFTIAGWDFAAGTGVWMMPDPGTGPALRWMREGTYCLYPQAGDVSGDCLVNLVDVAMMASNWLGCGYADQSLCP